MLRPLAILIATALALLAGCGGEEQGGGADAREMLEQAFATPVESGRLAMTAELQLDGEPLLGDGLEFQVSGPFTRREADLDVSVSGLGPALAGGLTLTRDNLFVTVGGDAYELGEETYGDLMDRVEGEAGRDARHLSLEALGIDVQEWLREPRRDGDEEVAGEPTTKLVAGIDAAAVFADLAPLAKRRHGKGELSEEERERLAGLVEDGTVTVWVSRDDHTIRRLALDVEFEVPEDVRSRFGGLEGGAASVDLTIADVGRPQRIEAPEDARPLDELLGRFGLDPERLLR